MRKFKWQNLFRIAKLLKFDTSVPMGQDNAIEKNHLPPLNTYKTIWKKIGCTYLSLQKHNSFMMYLVDAAEII